MLSHINIIDLTVARAGPVAVRTLADWGAEVIRVEPPIAHDRGSVIGKNRGADSQNLHRNKRSMCLDLKSKEGREILYKLIRNADVVVENFRSDVKNRLGINYEKLKEINPKIILASISGFGQTGPYQFRPGLDQIVQGMCGLMSITGTEETGPLRTGIAISDTTAGMYLGQGILAALLYREKTGFGQWVHTSLLESMLSKLDFQGARFTVNNEIPTPNGNFHPTFSPMGTFSAKNGLVNIAAHTDRMFRILCDFLKIDDLLHDDRFNSFENRVANSCYLNSIINSKTKEITSDELVDQLNELGIPCGPVYNIKEAFTDPQVLHLEMVKKAQHPILGEINLVRSPVNFSEFNDGLFFEKHAPDIGEHTKEILLDLGFDAEDISILLENEVIQ